MIDASSFANLHNAFWAENAPTSEHFVRRLNLEYTDRWSPPIKKPGGPIRAALVAEIAFAKFCTPVGLMSKANLEAIAIGEARRRLRPLTDSPDELDVAVSPDEKVQIDNLENNLRGFFKKNAATVVLRPTFSGCGYVDACEGDVVYGATLYEIKAVDRSFRSADIRQLITYCALNHASQDFDLRYIGIFNPRRGVSFDMSIDRVCREISGRSQQELLSEIVSCVSSGDISR
ncbi:hypothetical protein [Palleronia sp. LCG004]|uniref:hypothetical protein n=1 Tax=Palleronia sp. LCG004 TaxID=3079304 RepID=UPI0029432F11|nr:hypothetical protein [Palleronia sp. LCG004]WOI57140.1 hypothetical protein RVY76_04940 [Palleronia sp. LCG004]